jgi:hypothetical protein
LKAVAQCALNGLVMPKWLATAYLERYFAVKQCKVGSWDSEEAFGRPYPKGANLASRREKRIKRIKVVSAVNEAIRCDLDRPIDNLFWEEIGRLVGGENKPVGKTNAQELHSEAVRQGWAWSPRATRRLLLRLGFLPHRISKVSGYLFKPR